MYLKVGANFINILYGNSMAGSFHRKPLHLPDGNDFGDESIEKHNRLSKEQLLL